MIMTLITMAALFCCLLLMLSVTYAECHIKAFMLNVVMLSFVAPFNTLDR
jgi:hypothetical protein